MSKLRLDTLLVQRGLVTSRSQAESWIKLGHVTVNNQIVQKPGHTVSEDSDVKITTDERYVSRGGLKLASIAKNFGLQFSGKTVLDVGSSTGGFTDYALQHGARRVIAVDVGTDQLHSSLRNDTRIDLREKTDIRAVHNLPEPPDIVVIDLSFISLREVLPHIASLCSSKTQIVAMLKPQFEAGQSAKHKGVIKNDALRRSLLRDFETWARQHFVLVAKADSEVAGAKGNLERFYLLRTM